MTGSDPTTPHGRAWPLSVAPMVDRTDRHFRGMMRAITRDVLLYTEMISTSAALGPRGEQVLGFDPVEHPVALQLGGDDPARLAEATARATALGYDEIDLNCGCPSSRVQKGRMGVVLMKDPARVAQCVRAMRAATDRPVTVKHRLGVDEVDRYEDVVAFVDAVANAGADRLIVHARKAWLRGLSPKENRTIPPLRYEWVHALARDFPGVRFELNGGITTLDEAFEHVDRGLGGVMIGRAAYDDPMMFAEADARLAQRAGRAVAESSPLPSRLDVLHRLLPWVERSVAQGHRLSMVTRPMLGLAKGLTGARRFRQRVCEGARDPRASVDVLRDALSLLHEPADLARLAG